MGWGRYFLLGNLGQQLDLQDHQQEMDQMRQYLQSQYDTDRQQDQQLAALRKENAELKLYVTALVRLLTRKNVLTVEEVQRMVDGVEGSGGGV